ncbi:hypothetical protein J2S43_001694 [Catenuloplanes nepalensis]|uniref:Uncharacterized protein n=1 Tax=Catenuloplanes nepalensis TaxID=587533 RepID=A0ABT9MP38_9ACTN|nr:hypothetical protein [Catenuloplanes nepalensis]MDP9793182.1 hypothetical protein [Catenuloplanes nepalensis]
MSSPQRPVFFEGQYISAADLDAAVAHAREHAARHDRYLHEWGIAEGLRLIGEEQPGTDGTGAFVSVTLAPGVAIDGTGREIVVPEPVPLGEDLFRDTNGADQGSGDRYPVFLAGLDREPAPSGLTGTDSPATRVDESYQIIFGRPGDEKLVAERPAPGIGDGPGDGTAPWHILVGFVTWRAGRFRSVHTESGTARPPTAGVRAGLVAAPGGTLTLRSQLAAGEGGAVVTLTGDDGLRFGLHKADGSIESLLTVNPRGNLTIRGTIASGPAAGGMTAVSGVATDGTILPLPAGISAEQVTSGQVTLHTTVTPLVTGPPFPDDGVWLPSPVECTIDDDRRLSCRVRWLNADSLGGEPAARQVRQTPGAARYLVLAAVAATPEAT